MNSLRFIIAIPIILYLIFICGLYSVTFLILIPLKWYFPNFYFVLDKIAVKSLVNMISMTFNVGNCEGKKLKTKYIN